MGGPEGIVESIQIMKEGKASASEAVDCKWYIRAPPRSKVSLKVECRFDRQLEKCLQHCIALNQPDMLSPFKSAIISDHFIFVLKYSVSSSV